MPDRLATKASGLLSGGSFDAPEVLAAKAKHENFPVASRLLPRDARAGLMAIYGFARLTDDLGDQAEGDRLAMLDWLEADVERAATGNATRTMASATPCRDATRKPAHRQPPALEPDAPILHESWPQQRGGRCAGSARRWG